MSVRKGLPIVLLAVSLASALAQSAPQPSRYLYVWARSADTSQPDFLAVVDASPSSTTYGKVLSSVSTGVPVNLAHHTDYEMPKGGILFANDFSSGLTFRFDLRTPRAPKLLGMFGNAGPYSHSHSFVHLDNGHVLATYQMKGFMNHMPGALVELDGEGKLVRYGDAADPSVDSFIRPYSLAVVPALDRVVTSSTDMYGAGKSHVVQVWRLSDLKRIKTIRLPLGPGGVDGTNAAEPRVLPDGKTVLVEAENCGLYRMVGLEGYNPTAELVYDAGPGAACAVPAVAGHFWIETLSHGKPKMPLINLEGGGDAGHSMGPQEGDESHAVVALDVSDPAKPVEAGRVDLGPQDYPHWVAADSSGKRVVLTGFESLQNQIVIVNIGEHGELTIDTRFHDVQSASEPGIRFASEHWPHGGTGAAVPHGAVFSGN